MMKKTLLTLLLGIGSMGVLCAADLPEGAMPLASDGPVSQTIDSATDNGSFTVTFALDVDTLKQALAGTRTQVVDAHLNAGRKPTTDVGYAIKGGNVYYTYIQYFANQFTPLAALGESLESFVQGQGNLDSITGAVITLVHASYHDKNGTGHGSHYYLDIYTADGVKHFSGYSERLKISDRRLGTLSIPKESPARAGMMYADRALTDAQAAAANAKLAAEAGLGK